MKRTIPFLSILLITISCAQVKDIAYFQTFENSVTTIGIDTFDFTIKPKDILSITVVSSEPEASRRYNLVAPQPASLDDPVNYIYTQPTIQNYLVDNEGYINFPSLGKLHVAGQKKQELINDLEKRLAPFFSEEMPIITVRLLNFTVNILGEVRNPGKFTTTNERLTIFEGLALAGDMTIYGKRTNVKILREENNGDRKIYKVNLNEKNIFNSPVYFLQQNDVVYVEPNKSRSNSSMYGEAENYRISTLSVIISLATMATTIFGITRR